jgi:hydrogenase-4 component E
MAASIPTVPAAITGLALIAVLLSQLAILRLGQLEPIVRVYLVQSAAVCVFTALTGWRADAPELYGLAALTFVTKVVVIPILVATIIRRLSVEDRVRLLVPVPLTFLLAAALAAVGFGAATGLGLGGDVTAGLGVGLATLLIGFLFIAARPNAVAQLIGFLTLENGVFVASLTLAPGLPILVAVLLLLDVLIPAVAFGLVIRVLVRRVRSVHTSELTELRG